MKRQKMHVIAIMFTALFVTVTLLNWSPSYTSAAASDRNTLTNAEIEKIEKHILKQMDKGNIPGVSVSVMKGGEAVYSKGFGYSDVKQKKRVTPSTLFELGSTSKAFTGLGLLKLAEKGQVQLSDPIEKYIPGLSFVYKGNYQGRKINEEAQITLEQLLHHTSGIPTNSIGDIPVATEDDALEKVIMKLKGAHLESYPGERFSYATINYDILGLVIQRVSGKSYETYMTDEVLHPLGMNQTFLFREDAKKYDMSKGYKRGYLKSIEYEAPVYRGNTPAGYVITNGEDMLRWLSTHLNPSQLGTELESVIRKSHIPNRLVPPSGDGSSYAAGWYVHQKGGGEITHEGSNPNYYSYIVFRPEEQLGIAVLANMNSSYTYAIGHGILNTLLGVNQKEDVKDTFTSLDNLSVAVQAAALPFILVTLYSFVKVLFQCLTGKRKQKHGNRAWYYILILTVITGLLAFCMNKVPEVIYGDFPWSFVRVWAPYSFIPGIIGLFTSIVLFSFYYVLITLYPKDEDISYFSIIVLSVISGFGNALVIFMVNAAVKISDSDKFQTSLFMFFLLGLLLYVYGQRLVKGKLITYTNQIVYAKRNELINKVINVPFYRLEQLKKENIYTCLNNDTETISSFAGTVINGLTSIITISFCMIYLGIINIYGLLLTLVIIVCALRMNMIAGRFAERLWEQTRDIQNLFYKYINDLLDGFKELSLSRKKRNELMDETIEVCDDYRGKRIKADITFANTWVIGELLFTFVIGSVAFIFPIVFTTIQSSTLRDYIFVILFIAGPVNVFLDSIPSLTRVKVSWSRLKDLSAKLDDLPEPAGRQMESYTESETLEMTLSNVVYQYSNQEGEAFLVGPLNFTLRTGEICFITGGNGSGKSTLAKILTGLYSPTTGTIRINNEAVNLYRQNEVFAAVFSDYFLFDKLYGVQSESKQAEIIHYLTLLGLQDKVDITDGVFSTTKLSSGQRKRLALLISYLEDRPFYLFDEWASDQDPEFRQFFYETLLPQLRDKGKCVIAITHDDRYFHLADKTIKMERGKVVDDFVKLSAS